MLGGDYSIIRPQVIKRIANHLTIQDILGKQAFSESLDLRKIFRSRFLSIGDYWIEGL